MNFFSNISIIFHVSLFSFCFDKRLYTQKLDTNIYIDKFCQNRTWSRASERSHFAGGKSISKSLVNLFRFVKIKNYGKKLNPTVFPSTSLFYLVLYPLLSATHFCNVPPLAIFFLARAHFFPRRFLPSPGLPPAHPPFVGVLSEFGEKAVVAASGCRHGGPSGRIRGRREARS